MQAQKTQSANPVGPPMKNEWKFLDTILIRSAGFPFSLITQFRFKKTCAHFEVMWNLSQQIDQLATDIRSQILNALSLQENASIRNKLIKMREKINHKSPVHFPSENHSLSTVISQWNCLINELAKLSQEAEKTFQNELLEMRMKLRSLVQNNMLFREAMFLSSVGSSEVMANSYLNSNLEPRNKDARRRERLFMNYLQRLCTKNETTSFFGPINYGKFFRWGSKNLETYINPIQHAKKIANTEVFFSSWACRELARAMSQNVEIRPFIIPKLMPSYTLSKGHLYYFGLEEKELDTELLRVLQLIDGSRTFGEIQSELNGISQDRFWTAIASLASQGIISDYPLVSPHSENALHELLGFLANLSGSSGKLWKNRILKLDALRAQFRDAPFPLRVSLLAGAEQLFEEATGKNPKRGEGLFYRDRSIFYEECKGIIQSFEVGGELLHHLASSLGKVLDVLAPLAIAYWEFWQMVGGEVLRRLSKSGTEMSLIEFINEFDGVYQELISSPNFQNHRNAIEAVASCLKDAARGFEIDHDILIANIVDGLREVGYLQRQSYPLCVSPDIMIGSGSLDSLNDGGYTVYIGEIHPTLLPNAYTTLLFFCPWEEEHRKQLRDVLEKLAKPHAVLDVSLRRENKLVSERIAKNVLFLQEPPSNDLEISPILVTDLNVKKIGDELVLVHEKTKQYFYLAATYYLTENTTLSCLEIFTPPYIRHIPISFGKFTPRILLGGLVYQRAKWELSVEILQRILQTSDFELFLEAFHVKKELGLPRCVFARHPLERKPFFVDFENFFLIELLQHILRSQPEVLLAEFGPGEEELWLKMEGEHYCSELRFGVYAK